MFFGQRKKVDKAAEAKKKKKYASSDSDEEPKKEEDSDPKKEAEEDSDPKEDITCTVCKEEADVYCFECKFYFCPTDFNEVHSALEDVPEGEEPPSKKHASEHTPPKRAAPHKFRALIGLEAYRLDSLKHGWDNSKSEPQSVIFARRQAEERSTALAKQKATDEVQALESKKRREEENRALEAALLAKRQADAEYEAVQQEAELRRKKGVRIHGWKEDDRTDELWAKAKVFKTKRF